MISYNTRLLYTMKLLGTLSMRYGFRMKTPVDGKLLDKAVQQTMTRYPYLGKTVVVKDGAYVYEENKNPVPVVRTTDPLPKYASEEAGGHLILVDYEDDCIYFNMCHSVSAGRGLARWALSCIFAYEWLKTGRMPECPSVRRPDLPPEPGEDFLEPFFNLPDRKSIFPGFDPEVKPVGPTELEKLIGEGEGDGLFLSEVRLDGEEVMKRVKACNGSPSAYFAVLFYRSLIALMEEPPAYMNMAVACDSGEDLGMGETMSLITRFLDFVITGEDAGLSTGEMVQKGRKLIKEQMDPVIMADILRQEEKVLREMEKLPTLQEKAMYYATHSNAIGLTPSALVSYVGRFDMGELEEDVKNWFLGGVSNGRGIVIFFGSGQFRVEVSHKTEKNDRTVASFLKVLEKEGLAYEIDPAQRQNNVELAFPTEET